MSGPVKSSEVKEMKAVFTPLHSEPIELDSDPYTSRIGEFVEKFNKDNYLPDMSNAHRLLKAEIAIAYLWNLSRRESEFSNDLLHLTGRLNSELLKLQQEHGLSKFELEKLQKLKKEIDHLKERPSTINWFNNSTFNDIESINSTGVQESKKDDIKEKGSITRHPAFLMVLQFILNLVLAAYVAHSVGKEAAIQQIKKQLPVPIVGPVSETTKITQ